ncbi:hypothetical protein [Crassaminicella profunda]|uniref:hypothetical protein n=1 Tax=Crassaminicella profunda TaxID=1286698 RepID=UPI001CA5FD19|nr:hypothetical protein [Crassaminicella profunda]QZY54806.1 hypothetical protein K7H06_17545 [Crassaminicella profunda]
MIKIDDTIRIGKHFQELSEDKNEKRTIHDKDYFVKVGFYQYTGIVVDTFNRKTGDIKSEIYKMNSQTMDFEFLNSYYEGISVIKAKD